MKSRFGLSAMAVFLSLAATSSMADAGIDEVRGGVLAQSCCGQGSDKEEGIGLSADVLFASPEFLSVLGAPRPVLGASIAADSDATSHIYTGVEWNFRPLSRFFVNGGFGGAIHNGETKFDPVADAARVHNTLFLGCRALFRLSADAGYQVNDQFSAMVSWSHLSNAGLCDVNEGLDQLGIRVGYSF